MLEVLKNMAAFVCMVSCFIVIFAQQKKIGELKSEVAKKESKLQKLRDYLKRLV